MTTRTKALEAAVTSLVPAAAQLFRRLRIQSVSRRLTWAHVSVMKRLDQLGESTATELARIEAYTPQAVSITLAGLERQGLVERKANPSDARQVLFSLSPQGVASVRDMAIAQQEWLWLAVSKLTVAEQRTLLAAVPLIERIADSSSPA